MNNPSKAAQKKPKSNLIDGWEVVIGIEIHTRLQPNLKFSRVLLPNLVKTRIRKQVWSIWPCRVYCQY